MGIAHPHTRRSRRLAQGESLRSPRLRDPPTFSSVLLSSPAPCLTSPPKLPPPQALHGAEFQHHLVELRKCTGVMPYTALLKEFQRTVPDATEADATRVCDALASAGAVLKQGTLVYLRPDEVAEALRAARRHPHAATAASRRPGRVGDAGGTAQCDRPPRPVAGEGHQLQRVRCAGDAVGGAIQADLLGAVLGCYGASGIFYGRAYVGGILCLVP